MKDIGANFFIYHNDIGKPRNKVSAPKLKELNPICIVNTVDVLDEAVIESHSVVVVTQVLPLPQLLHLNELCRKHKVSFFYTYTSGVSLDIFVDHGPDHIVNDFTGEKPIQKIITEITPVSTTTTLIRYDTPEGQLPIALTSGYFEVTEVEGIEEINNRLYPITHEDSDPAKTIKIEFGIPNGAKYVSGGLLTEKKVPTKYPMESLASKLKNPGDTFSEPPTLVLTDLINFGSETQQHIAFYAVHSFFTENGRLPAICDENDSIAVAAIAKKLLSDGSIALDGFDIDEDYIKKYN